MKGFPRGVLIKRSAMAAYIRQLSNLGLHPKQIMPQIIEALTILVGAEAGAFWFLDENHRVCDVYSQTEELYEELPCHLADFYDHARLEQALGFDFPAPARAIEHARSTSDLDMAPSQTRFHFEVLEPAANRHRLMIAAKEGGRWWGAAVLTRPHEVRGFSAKDVALGADIARYLVDAVRARTAPTDDFTPGDEFGIVVADHDDRILFQNTVAKRLLYFAASSSTLVTRFSDVTLPAWLKPLTDRVRRIASGQNAPTPILQRQNDWGKVVCRAHRMEARAGNSSELIGIHLQRHEPTVVRIARAALNAGLSNGQRELCVHLANDRRYVEIAEIMGISEHTVIDYTRKIYQRLNVCSRRELLRKLIHAPARANECSA